MTACRFRAVLTGAVGALAIAAAALGGEPAAGRIVGGTSTHTVTAGESWRSVGSRVGVDPQVLAEENALSLNKPLRPGVVLRVDNRHIVPALSTARTMVINLPQRMLFFADETNHVTGLPIAAGRSSWRTPLGAFHVRTKERDPSWEVPPSIQEDARRAGKSLPAVVPPGPDNPLGKFWLGLTIPNVGIHGTNAPSSIYRLATHGCMRLHPDDIEWLFGQVEIGWPGQIVYEPVLLAVVGDEVFLEAHPDAYRRVQGDVRQQVRDRAAALGVTDRIDWILVDRELQRRSGTARSIARPRDDD